MCGTGAAKSIWLAAKLGHLDSIYNLGVLTLQAGPHTVHCFHMMKLPPL